MTRCAGTRRRRGRWRREVPGGLLERAPRAASRIGQMRSAALALVSSVESALETVHRSDLYDYESRVDESDPSPRRGGGGLSRSLPCATKTFLMGVMEVFSEQPDHTAFGNGRSYLRPACF